eukprot:COSAG04_NODE_2036_length_4958_cov_2.183165_1_plen_146_part_10
MALWAGGSMVAYEPDMQPKLNGAGREIIPMSDEQKCELQSCSIPRAAPARRRSPTLPLSRSPALPLARAVLAGAPPEADHVLCSCADEFDLQGYLILPGIIPLDEVAEIREHQLRFRTDPESLPEEERDCHGGPSVQLLDHPAVVG